MKGTEIFAFLIPIFAVLPFGGAFLKDYTSGFLKLSILKKSRNFYVADKLKTVGLYSFLLFLLIGALGLVLYSCFWYPLDKKELLPFKEIVSLIFMILRLSLIGSMLASLSGMFGALFLNYYMAYGLPFVMYYMLIILKDRYLPEAYSICPKEWIWPQGYWGPFHAGLFIFLVILLFITATLHSILLRLRISEIT